MTDRFRDLTDDYVREKLSNIDEILANYTERR
jgi:hypothetical protein